MSTQV